MQDLLTQGNIEDYLASVAAKTSAPGGGAVAAISGGQAVALIAMVCEFTKCESDQDQNFIKSLLDRANQARVQFIDLAQQDMDAFSALMATFKLPKSTPSEKQIRTEQIQAALNSAAGAPQSMMTLAASFTSDLVRLRQIGNQNLITDTGIAALLLTSTILAAEMNVLINLKSITAPSDQQAFFARIEADKQSLPSLSELAKTIGQSLT